MKKIIIVLLAIGLIIGCTNNDTYTNKKTISVGGHTYTLIRAGKTNANGVVDVELWEREGVTNRYYTPSVDGTSMHSIMK